MAWLQVRIACAARDTGDWEDALLAVGALAVTYLDAADQPVLEPGVGEMPLWNEVVLVGLFDANVDTDGILARLPTSGDRSPPRVEILEDKDWEREWMHHYAPMRFGDRLWICPSWLSPPDPTAINILLDPGLAFGTGTHPTTAMCLEAMAGLALESATVVDYGCGSGILAIAAARLGASRVIAIDNDPQALAACRSNAQRNSIEPRTLSVHLPGDTPATQADLVVANILAGPLLALSNTLLGLLAPGGRLLLAGLLEEQAADLVAHYAHAVMLVPVAQREEWVCLLGQRGV